MPDEHVFLVTYQNKMTCLDRCASIHIFANCEADAFNLCLDEAYKLIQRDEGLFKIELLYII